MPASRNTFSKPQTHKLRGSKPFYVEGPLLYRRYDTYLLGMVYVITKVCFLYSTFDRKLNMKLKDEEQDIRLLRPHSDYK